MLYACNEVAHARRCILAWAVAPRKAKVPQVAGRILLGDASEVPNVAPVGGFASLEGLQRLCEL